MNFETVIGLETHIELKTNSKIFSPSPTVFGAEPNQNTSERDWGYPGTLPVVNEKVLELGARAALALNCEISREMSFDRKNYFYPDNPSAYQVTQQNQPIGRNGYLDVEVDGKTHRVRINRVHLEEDAGSLTHSDDGYSYVDLNRQGVALIEIVTEPDISSPAVAYAYLEALRETILFAGVSDVKMEEGSLRCDGNISIRPYGQKEFGVKSELKNLNSFNFVRRGLEYEEKRQAQILLSGGVVEQDTRRYDEKTGKTVQMRLNTEAADYRYFPDPDLPKIVVTDEWVEEIRQSLPELPKERRKRYVEEYGLTDYDAHVLTLTKEMSDFFDETVNIGAEPKQVATWLMGEASAYMNKEQVSLDETKLTPANLKDMLDLITDGTISSKMAKELFEVLISEGGDAKEVVEARGMAQISDPEELGRIIDQVIEDNPQSLEDYLGGHDRAFGFFIGQTMKATKGQANPQIVNKVLAQTLKELKEKHNN